MSHLGEYEKSFLALNDLDETSAALKARGIAEQARGAGHDGFALFFEGEAACLEGRLRKGEKLMREAASRLPAMDFILTDFGILLSRLGRTGEALYYLDRALEQNDDSILALGQKGVSLAKLCRDHDALACFDRVLLLDRSNVHALRNKGVILSRLGREKEALEYLECALAADSKDEHARAERKNLLEEMRLRGTPLGWLLIWVRKKVLPFFKRLYYRYRFPVSAQFPVPEEAHQQNPHD